MSGIKDLISRLKNAVNDNKGFFQQGHITAQPIQQAVQQWQQKPSNTYFNAGVNAVKTGITNFVQTEAPKIKPFGEFLGNAQKNIQQTTQYFNPTSNNGNNFWSTPVANKMASIQQNIQGPQKQGPMPTFPPLVSQQNINPPVIDKFADVIAQTTRAVVNVVPNTINAVSKYAIYNPETKKIFPNSMPQLMPKVPKEVNSVQKLNAFLGTEAGKKFAQDYQNWNNSYAFAATGGVKSGGPMNPNVASNFERLFGKGNGSNLPAVQGSNVQNIRMAPPVKPVGQINMLPWETKDYLNKVNPNGLLAESPAQTNYRRSADIKPNEAYIPTTQMTRQEAKTAADMAQLKAQEDNKIFRQIFADWIGKRDSAKTKATLIASSFTTVPGNPVDIIKAIEDPTIKINPEQSSYITKLRNTYDQLFKDARDSGIDMKYLKDYITHIWDKSDFDVQQMYKSAGQKFGSASERIMPTYQEGIDLGLKPKFSNPAQILESYVRRLEETKANVELFTKLKKEGLIVHGSTVRSNPGFAPVMAPGFPPAKVNIGDNTTWVSSWYAPVEIASSLNKVFTPPSVDTFGKVISGIRKASSVIQDVTMSGGIPYTSANAWTFAQATKEMLSGRVASPMMAFVRSLTEGGSNKFFADNAGQIIKMQEHNIPVNSSFKIENMIDPSTIKRTLGEKMSNAWNTAVNDPTFQRFSPQLQISLFNDIEVQALKAGKSAEEAADIAAQAVKNFYGVTGTDKIALSNKLTEDLKGAIFFAPKYRGTMINFWVNNVKAMLDPLALKNRKNIVFIVGAILTYLVMNEINKKNTGVNMWDNPSGKEMTMMIKTKDGYIGVPFLSSIATVPRTVFSMGKKASEGDLTGAALQGKGFLSSAIRPQLDLITNQNYYGGQITDPNNPQWGDRALYLAGQYNHPYIQAGMNVVGQNLSKDVKSKLGLTSQPEPAYQTVSKALEMPFRFYNNRNGGDALQTSYYFDDRESITKSLAPNDLTAWNMMHPQTTNGRQVENNILNSQQKAVIMLNNPQVQQAEYMLAMAQQQRGEQVDPIWNLTPTQRQIVFASRVQLPGQKNTYDTYLSSQPWYKPYLAQQSQFYDSLPASSNPQTTIPGQMAYPEPDSYTQQQMDLKNWKDPSVQAWFTARDQYNNQQLLGLGLPSFNSGFASYTKKPKKVAAIKLKAFPKTKKLTSFKPKKLKLTSTKVTKTKPITGLSKLQSMLALQQKLTKLKFS